jgi:NAD(P)-dependent dehydrogenase (short-subunit alcohol dehydrogenase family)
VVLQLGSEGARVVVSGLEQDPIDDAARTARGIGPGAGNVGEEGTAGRFVAAALEECGRLDILVNSAATEANRMCRANARSLVVMTRAALPSLRRSRAVLSAGSTAGVSGTPNMAICGATKGFATSFTSGVAAELAADGVRAVAVVPGPTETGQTRPEEGRARPTPPRRSSNRRLWDAVRRRERSPTSTRSSRGASPASWPGSSVIDGGTGISRGLPGRLGDIPAPPLTLPVRQPLGGFEHDIGEKPGEAG